ncbi:MAG: CHAT domain-containing protein [Ktedonobacteraceae bacterium]
MDDHLFLQQLRTLDFDEACIYLQGYAAQRTDYTAIAHEIADEAFRQRGIDPFICLKLAELLIFFGEHVHHPSFHTLGLKLKGDALHFVGHHQAALEALDEAGKEYLLQGDEIGWAHSRISWLPSCAWLGKTEEALQAASLARDIFLQHKEDFWACAVDINTAVIYKQMGQYQKALDLYEHILSIYATLTDFDTTYIKRATAIIKNNQSLNQALLGNFTQAYRLLQEAQASFVELEENVNVISTEINLADLDYAQGYFGSALQNYYQARDLYQQHHLDDPHLLTELMCRMSACLVKLNRAQEASQLAAEAVEIFRRLDTSLDTGDALREYATTLVASGKPREALSALEEAWQIFTHGGFEHQANATRLQQAELFLEIGPVASAYEQATQVKQYFDAQGLVASSTRASMVMANSLITLVQQSGAHREDLQFLSILKEAMALTEEVTHIAHKHNLQEQSYKSLYLSGRLSLLQNDLALASEYFEGAISRLDAMLDDMVYDLGSSFLRSAWMVYEDMIALCRQRNRDELAFGYLERARSMALRQYLKHSKESQGGKDGLHSTQLAPVLRSQHELELREWQTTYRKYSAQLVDLGASLSTESDQQMIRAELKRCEIRLSELFERLHFQQANSQHSQQTLSTRTHTPREENLAELRRHLAPNQLLIAYFMYKDRLVTFALSTERLVTCEQSNAAVELRHLLPLLLVHLQPLGWRNPQDPPQQAIRGLLHKLYRILIAPIANLLPPAQGFLTIVPYGPLHNLPFHALYDGSRFLIEDFQVSYLPTASVLTHFDMHGRTRNSRAIQQDTPPRPLVFGYSSSGHLQRAIDEAKLLSDLLRADCYLEEEATIARLIELATGRPIIHLATHGHSRLDSPNFSYVRLADGQLNSIDAFRLDLEDCELVTLSGCETGLALIGGGDEQLGLGRAFLAAGASSLVMSLWPVEDNATNELMQSFYHHLFAGESKVQALRSAQCSLLQRPEPMYKHPYFWAAFRLVGDISPLHHQGV